MKSNNPQIEILKQMVALEERRMELQEVLDGVLDRMAALRDQLFQDNGSKAQPASSPAQAQRTGSGTAPTRRKRRGRGTLKETIMGALASAGSAGVRVKDLAVALGTKPVNIHSWFHSTSKRNPDIKKISGGHYRLEGSGASASAPDDNAASAKPLQSTRVAGRGPGRPRKAAVGGTKRGALSAEILKQLELAGPEGANVRGMASKIGAKYKNIYIWFATTGKKNPAIKKLGPATYALSAA